MSTRMFTGNNNSVRVEPKDSDRIKKQENVQLWFVGVDLLSETGVSPTITVKGSAIRLPELGQSLTVPRAWAKDIVLQTTHVGEKGVLTKTMFTNEEGGERIAEKFREAIKSGKDPKKINVNQMVAKAVSSNLEDDDILAEAINRGLIPKEMIDKINSKTEEGDAPEEEEKTTKKSSSSKKKEGK